MIKRIKEICNKFNSTGFIHLMGSSVINKVLGFVSSFILIRIIPKESYGIYANADNILGLFCVLEGLSMTSTFLQFGCTNTGKMKNQIWSFCFYSSVLFQVFLCISILITGLFVPIKIIGTNKLLVLMAFLPLFRIIRDMQQIYLRTESKNQIFAYSNTFSTIVTVILSCSLSFFFFEKGLIVSGYIAAIISIAFLYVKGQIKFPKLDFSLGKTEKKKILKFAIVSTINNSTSSIMYILDTFILGLVVAQSTVTASYKVATKIPTALSFIPVCLMTYIYPYFAKHKDDKNWCLKNFKKILFMFGLFNFAICLILIVFSEPIIRLFFGSQYIDAKIPFCILCTNYSVQSTFNKFSGQLLVSQEKLGFNTFMGFASSALNTILNLILIPMYGSTGAAIATLIVSLFTGMPKTIYLYKLLKQKNN